MRFIFLAPLVSAQVFASSDLQRLPNADIKVAVKNTFTVAEYCPDNTCSGIKILKGSKTNAEKYLYLYLFSQSEYIYIEKWKKLEATQGQIKNILSILSSKKCKSRNLVKEVNCVLTTRVQDKTIELYGLRGDEGNEVEFPLELKN